MRGCPQFAEGTAPHAAHWLGNLGLIKQASGIGLQDVTAEALAIDKRFGSSVTAQDSSAPYGTVTPRCPVSVYPGSPRGQPPIHC